MQVPGDVHRQPDHDQERGRENDDEHPHRPALDTLPQARNHPVPGHHGLTPASNGRCRSGTTWSPPACGCRGCRGTPGRTCRPGTTRSR
ncbi:hypothetical protein [Ornithinimicrobium kibberense]|uniref:hypothetical protein n=1 Tax=Ornithinimicrobium kibberense TaxID=282060 RepID=UPI003614F7F4